MYLDKTRFHFKSIILGPTSNEPVLLILYFLYMIETINVLCTGHFMWSIQPKEMASSTVV